MVYVSKQKATMTMNCILLHVTVYLIITPSTNKDVIIIIIIVIIIMIVICNIFQVFRSPTILQNLSVGY